MTEEVLPLMAPKAQSDPDNSISNDQLRRCLSWTRLCRQQERCIFHDAINLNTSCISDWLPAL